MSLATRLQDQLEAFRKLLSSLSSDQAEQCADNPDKVLPSRKYPADVAATTMLWVDEAVVVGGLLAQPKLRCPWMGQQVMWSDVERLRDKASARDGLQMLADANRYLVAATEDAPAGVTWNMSFNSQNPVDVDGCLTKIVVHGDDHLAKVHIAVLKVQVGLPLYDDIPE